MFRVYFLVFMNKYINMFLYFCFFYKSGYLWKVGLVIGGELLNISLRGKLGGWFVDV